MGGCLIRVENPFILMIILIQCKIISRIINLLNRATSVIYNINNVCTVFPIKVMLENLILSKTAIASFGWFSQHNKYNISINMR